MGGDIGVSRLGGSWALLVVAGQREGERLKKRNRDKGKRAREEKNAKKEERERASRCFIAGGFVVLTERGTG